jgi:hypothetical protein
LWELLLLVIPDQLWQSGDCNVEVLTVYGLVSYLCRHEV